MIKPFSFFKNKKFLLFGLVSLLVGWGLLQSPSIALAQTDTQTAFTIEGEVVQIVESGKESVLDELLPFQVLEVKVTKGQKVGDFIKIKNSNALMGANHINYVDYRAGDKLRISVAPQDVDSFEYHILGKVKRPGIISLTLLFILVVAVIGRTWGILSLLGLAISFLVIFKVVLPLILNGTNPILAAIVGSTVIIPTTFYISHGFNRKTHVGVIATLVALVITGLLATYFVDATYLTGFASEEAGFLFVERGDSINIKGLLLAGIIIGTLGILDDITVGQASVVQQIKKARPQIKPWELFTTGMKVGQDHISSMVNTLVLVYSGSALPLLLLFFDRENNFVVKNMWDVLEQEIIAEEIVRMLVGSIGLVLAAPLATGLAVLILGRTQKNKKD